MKVCPSGCAESDAFEASGFRGGSGGPSGPVAGRKSSRGHNEKLLPSLSTGVRYGTWGLGFILQWRSLPVFFALRGFSCEEAATQDDVDGLDPTMRPCKTGARPHAWHGMAWHGDIRPLRPGDFYRRPVQLCWEATSAHRLPMSGLWHDAPGCRAILCSFLEQLWAPLLLFLSALHLICRKHGDVAPGDSPESWAPVLPLLRNPIMDRRSQWTFSSLLYRYIYSDAEASTNPAAPCTRNHAPALVRR